MLDFSNPEKFYEEVTDILSKASQYELLEYQLSHSLTFRIGDIELIQSDVLRGLIPYLDIRLVDGDKRLRVFKHYYKSSLKGVCLRGSWEQHISQKLNELNDQVVAFEQNLDNQYNDTVSHFQIKYK